MTDLLVIKEKECYQQSTRYGSISNGETFCDLIFDGLMCWNATKAGTVASQSCPDYLVNSKGNATKVCEITGEWYVNEQFNRIWTNYSQCWKLVDSETALVEIDAELKTSALFQKWFPVIKQVSHWGYSISLIALITAMLIFLIIKKLQCARNRLHMHLFMSHIMRASMSLLKDFLFVEGVAMSSDVVIINGKLQYIKERYNWICKAIIGSRNYFIIANYMLILMEGIYLHNLIFSNILSDNSTVTTYYIFGWTLPLAFVIPWVILRVIYEDTMCWTTSQNNYYSSLVQIPIATSVFINFVLFLRILRILLVKLNSSTYIQRRKKKYRRLVLSTLILVPLFGVPYVLSLIMSFCSSVDEMLELIWIFSDQTFTAFQGLFVALLYCLLNSEVHIEVKQKYLLFKDRQAHIRASRERTISYTQQYGNQAVLNTDDADCENCNMSNYRLCELHKTNNSGCEE